MSKKGEKQDFNKPWISMATGVKTMAVVSVVLVILIGSQAIPQLGWLEGGLLAIGFTGSVWVIFYGNLLFQRFIRGNSGSKD